MIEIAIGIFFAALDERKKKERKQQEHNQQQQQRTPQQRAPRQEHTDSGKRTARDNRNPRNR